VAKTTSKQDEWFIDALFSPVDSKSIIDAIKDALSGDCEWVVEWVSKEFNPEDVFDERILAAWAKENGWSKNE